MKAFTIIKAGIGTGAAILLLAAAPAAQASSGATVPCSGPGGGPAGLIAAINTANASGGAMINLAAGCTYALTAANNTNPMSGGNGLPVITSRIILNGFHTTIAGNGTSFRILMVTGSGNLTLQGLTVTGGHTGGLGGGIFNLEGTLTLDHSKVTGNASEGAMMSAGGGGIASGTLGTGPLGTTSLNFSQVIGNTTSASAGGILNHAGTLTLNASQVNGNTAAVGGGGIGSGTGGIGGNGSSMLPVNFSQADGNTSGGGPLTGAGGIANGGTAIINASQVNSNTTPAKSSGSQGGGGGIANLNITPLTGVPDSGILTVNLSQVRGNSAGGIGGGILEDGVNPDDSLGPPGGPLTLNASQVTGNTAADGGGIYASSGSPVALKLTLVARNVPGNCFPLGSIPGCTN